TRTRTPGGEHPPSVRSSFTWVAARIKRVQAESGNCIVVSRHRRRCAGNPVGKLRETGLGYDDCTGVAKIPRECRFIWRHKTVEGERTARGRHVGSVDVVLQRDWNPVQRSPYPVLLALLVSLLGDCEHGWIHGNRGMQLVVIERNAN